MKSHHCISMCVLARGQDYGWFKRYLGSFIKKQLALYSPARYRDSITEYESRIKTEQRHF